MKLKYVFLLCGVLFGSHITPGNLTPEQIAQQELDEKNRQTEQANAAFEAQLKAQGNGTNITFKNETKFCAEILLKCSAMRYAASGTAGVVNQLGTEDQWVSIYVRPATKDASGKLIPGTTTRYSLSSDSNVVCKLPAPIFNILLYNTSQCDYQGATKSMDNCNASKALWTFKTGVSRCFIDFKDPKNKTLINNKTYTIKDPLNQPNSNKPVLQEDDGFPQYRLEMENK